MVIFTMFCGGFLQNITPPRIPSNKMGQIQPFFCLFAFLGNQKGSNSTFLFVCLFVFFGFFWVWFSQPTCERTPCISNVLHLSHTTRYTQEVFVLGAPWRKVGMSARGLGPVLEGLIIRRGQENSKTISCSSVMENRSAIDFRHTSYYSMSIHVNITLWF